MLNPKIAKITTNIVELKADKGARSLISQAINTLKEKTSGYNVYI